MKRLLLFALCSCLAFGQATKMGPIATKSINSIRFADQYAGASIAAQINAAMADCPAYNNASTDIGCLVVIPPSMACGEGNQAPDNVMLWDFRGCAQSQGLRFNVGTAATTIRSKMFLQDNVDLTTIGATSGGHGSATFYVLAYPDKANTAANTVEAGNFSISTNTITGNVTVPVIGLEAEAFVHPAAGGGFSIADARGFTSNIDCTPTTGSLTCTRLVSVYGQAPTKGTGATVTNAYSGYFESPALAVTGEKQGLLNQGSTRLNDRVAVGSSSAINTGAGLAIFDPASIAGTSQFGIQVALQAGTGATTEAAGGIFRADVPASTTQAINNGLTIQTPSIGSGGAITNWFGIDIQKAPAVGTQACSIRMAGSTSGTLCLNPPATGGGNVNYPSGTSSSIVSGTLTTTAAASDNLAITGVTASSHCSLTATNASAATNTATSYISAKATNQVTVTHTATASMTYDVLCTVN